jgi:hypothetical protein
MATVDREEFRRRAQEKAKAALQQRKLRESGEVVGIANNFAEQSNVEGKFSSGVLRVTEEEKKVLDAYRKWKETRDSSKAKTLKEEGEEGGEESGEAAPMAETKEQKIARLKRKAERRQRVEALKFKLAEKRNGQKPDAIREQAKALKERISNVRESLKALNEEGEIAPTAPMAPPAGAATAPGIPGADGMTPNLPPEITAEIQNIAAAAQSLAQMAGVAPAAPTGAEVGADIPAETAGAAGSGMLPESAKAERVARIKALLEKKKADKAKEKKDDREDKKDGKAKPFEKKKESAMCQKCGKEPCECDNTDKMIEEARARALARREALKKIRSDAMQEASYDAENAATTDVQGFVKSALDTAGAMGGAQATAYGTGSKDQIQQAGVKVGGPDASMPGNSGATSSIKPAHVWKARDLSYGGKIPDKLPKNLPESVEESWDQRHVDHYIERRELNFKKLLENGQLG